jgi:hypothetical protein
MAELKTRPVRDRHSHAQESEPVEVTRASVRSLNSQWELDRRLDQALVETFPASDSIAIIIC